MSSTTFLMADDIRSLQAAAGKPFSCLKNSFACGLNLPSQMICVDLPGGNSIKRGKPMENETEKPEKQPLKEQAASAYRLKQAETLLKALGYLQIPNSKFWKKPDPEQEGKKFFLAGKQICPTDSKPHDFLG